VKADRQAPQPDMPTLASQGADRPTSQKYQPGASRDPNGHASASTDWMTPKPAGC